MSRHDFFPDEETTITGYAGDPDAAWVTIDIAGTSVRFEGDADDLIALGWGIITEIDPIKAQGLRDVTGNGRNPDAQDPRIAAIADHTQKAISLLEDAIASITPDPLLLTEEKRTPETMERGGWFRVPPSKVWRQLHGMTFDNAGGNANAYVGVSDSAILRLDTTYPYMTDEAFHAACDKEQAR